MEVLGGGNDGMVQASGCETPHVKGSVTFFLLADVSYGEMSATFTWNRCTLILTKPLEC